MGFRWVWLLLWVQLCSVLLGLLVFNVKVSFNWRRASGKFPSSPFVLQRRSSVPP